MDMQAGTVYRWILVEAATMKWMHLSFCTKCSEKQPEIVKNHTVS